MMVIVNTHTVYQDLKSTDSYSMFLKETQHLNECFMLTIVQ